MDNPCNEVTLARPNDFSLPWPELKTKVIFEKDDAALLRLAEHLHPELRGIRVINMNGWCRIILPPGELQWDRSGGGWMGNFRYIMKWLIEVHHEAKIQWG